MESSGEEETSIDNVDEEEDFDFDGHDASLSNVPSWIDEESETDMKINQEGYTHDQSEDFLDDDQEEKIPDTSEIFNSSDSDALSQVALVEEQRDAYIDALRQLQADFENYKKRVVRDSIEDADLKSGKIIEDLLPVLDNFELALKNIKAINSDTKKLKKGIELVFTDFVNVLEKQGLEVIEADGAVFDPEVHDAVSHEDNDEHEVEVVVEVLRPGYKVRGRVVRPAMVKVAK